MNIERKSYVLGNEAGVSPGSEFFIASEECRDTDVFNHLVMCGQYHCIDGYVIDRLFYDCIFIAYIDQGAMDIDYEGSHYTALKGDVVFMDLKTPHRYGAAGSLYFSWLHIKGTICNNIYEHYRSKNGIIIHDYTCNDIKTNIRFILSSFKTGQMLSKTDLSSAIYKTLISSLSAENNSTASKSTRVSTVAIEYMKYNLSSKINLIDIADSVHMSKYHFIRVFKNNTGYSPYEYLQKLRMDTAKHLLQTTDKTIGEISNAVGYQSEMGFTSAFSEKVGISPGRYRSSPF
ncbi:helix-turn-helix domain-containing protein [Robinsoniella sp. RHS]|uniref:AraC family transcriptional regulator n=1 Tax=Robinsoniella sp. RHS TaxID=1504536 RepID=UPI00064A1588